MSGLTEGSLVNENSQPASFDVKETEADDEWAHNFGQSCSTKITVVPEGFHDLDLHKKILRRKLMVAIGAVAIFFLVLSVTITTLHRKDATNFSNKYIGGTYSGTKWGNNTSNYLKSLGLSDFLASSLLNKTGMDLQKENFTVTVPKPGKKEWTFTFVDAYFAHNFTFEMDKSLNLSLFSLGRYGGCFRKEELTVSCWFHGVNGINGAIIYMFDPEGVLVQHVNIDKDISDFRIQFKKLSKVMSLNLNKHGMAMQKAWKEVANPKSSTNWALYGYDTGTFDLNLVATGEDGIEELKEDLSPEKVLYAFIRIDDESATNVLPKFVFLVWIGESTPGTRKGKAATHVRTIEQYFHGHHLTINARNEDDVDVDEITAKVAKISVSATGGQAAGLIERPEPVGSCHKKVEVRKELPDMNERERFWNEQESREKQRIDDERKRKIEEQKKIDQERRQREEEETKAREALIKDRERKISQIKVAKDKSDESRMKQEQQRWEEQQEADRREEMERQNRGEEMRRKRSEEAKQLISRSSGQSARAVFERNTSMGQMNFRKNSAPPPSYSTNGVSISGVNHQPKEDFPKVPVEPNQINTEDIVVPPPESFSNEVKEPEVVPPPPDVTHNSQPDLIQDVTAQEKKSEPDVTKAPALAGASAHSGYGICAMALYDYQAADETEISFDPGQIITHIDKIDPGWWQGLSPSGTYGLFPSNYVDLIDPKDITQQH